MKNLAIFTITKKTMDFFEVTGGFRLDSVLEGPPSRKVEPPARREGCCLFVTYQWRNPQAPIYRGNAGRAKLPHGYVSEKTSPEALALKKVYHL
ncbi:MAG: hypothetical protein R6T98_12990 [Desulfatiglandales bacterium]